MRITLATAFVLAASAACSRTPIEPVSQQHTGTLEDGDALYHEDQSYYDEYTFEADAGMKIVITMNSDDFDAFLHLEGPQRFSMFNDDFGESTNSRIEIEAPSKGTYTVLANSLWAPHECEPETPGGEPTCTFSGAYSLNITTTAN